MKHILIIFSIVCTSLGGFSQPESFNNVGIDTPNAVRARLEVIRVAGNGATSGAFGTDGAGISLQRNFPTIGYNQYRDLITTGSQGRYMTDGFAALQFFDPNSGTFVIDMFPSGTANSFTPGGVRALTVLADGNVGIRTSSSSATLTVARGDGLEGTAVFTGTQHSSKFNEGVSENTYIRAGVDASNVYFNKIPAGDVFIGNSNTRLLINNPPTSPSYTIDLLQPVGVHSISILDGNGYNWHQQLRHVNFTGQGDGIMLEFYYVNSSKGRFQYWDGAYVTFSDRRLKKNIEALPPVLDKVALLNPVSYEGIQDNPNHERSIGFIAQEVKVLFPGLVRQINNTSRTGQSVSDLNTMTYSGFGVIAIKSLQEQWQQITRLEAEHADLIKKLEVLESKLNIPAR